MTTTMIQTPALSSSASEHGATMPDGTELFYRMWRPAVPSTRSLVLLHRGHEHSGRFEQLVRELQLDDFWVFAPDQRGHGRSPGQHGYAEHFGIFINDVESFVRHICAQHELPQEDMVVLGHSVAGVTASAWVHDYARPIRGMILVTPAFRIKLYVPLALPALRFRMLFGGQSFIKSYVRANVLTHDPGQRQSYREDPLISRSIATNILIDLHDTATRIMADAAAITTPTLLLSAGSDWVVKNAAQRKFFNRLGSPLKRSSFYPGMYHALLHEQDRAPIIDEIRQFILNLFANEPRAESPKPGEQPHTHHEFAHLSTPLPWWNPKRWSFALQRLSMKSICRLSRGIQLGWRTGFDSGQSLDYIYRNQPAGITPLGRLIDFFYLNAIGWRGIRVRKSHIQSALAEAVAQLRESGNPPRIVDIAAGGGRYLLEILSRPEFAQSHALLLDRSTQALDEARKTAAALNLNNVTIAPGDAFDAHALSQLDPRPNLAIVSGLYELFADNQLISNSLSGLAQSIESGGFLIYTNQPWHPQIEMIARVLVNRDNQPWIMRRRTQAEIDQLVRSAGFVKLRQWIDRWGIFTVSLAQRVRP